MNAETTRPNSDEQLGIGSDSEEVLEEDESDDEVGESQYESGEAQPSHAIRLENNRKTAHSKKEVRKKDREGERTKKAEERSGKWRGRWDKLKNGVSGAWEGTKSFVKKIPDAPSYAMDLVDDVYDYSAAKVVTLGAGFSRSIAVRTTNLANDTDALFGLITNAGNTLRNDFTKRRIDQRLESLNESSLVIENKVVNTTDDDLSVAKEQAKTIEALLTHIKKLEDKVEIARLKKIKTNRATSWLRGFLN